MPAFVFMLSYFGLELPVRHPSGAAHYAVDTSQLGASYFVLKVYEQCEHFTRTVATAI
jgi:hypothetical protein